MLKIKYKNYSFNVVIELNGSAEKESFTIISIDSKNKTVEDFNDTVFFDSFVGYEALNTDENRRKITVRIKRAFARFLFIKDPSTEKEEESTVVVSSDKKTSKPTGAIDRIIYETVEEALSSEGVKGNIDKMVKQIIDENGIVPFRTEITVKTPDGKKRDAGLQHFEFERVLKTISAGVNIALVGPAGSGKTTLVKNVAKTLGKEFSSMSVSTQSTAFDFFGYKNHEGKYVSTLFRERYEKGGVFLMDEFDNGNPNVIAATNQASANEEAPFPDKMVKRHKDFILVMAGNTYGTGATMQYVGRNKLDAATLDRFAFIYVDYDEDFEEKIARNKDWCSRVQKYRANVRGKKIQAIVSPRATFMGESLLEAGLSQSQVEEMLIFKGLSSDERNLIKL